jgi:hypothetical protein
MGGWSNTWAFYHKGGRAIIGAAAQESASGALRLD